MQILQKKQYGLGKFILASIVAILILMFLTIPKYAEYRAKAKELKAAKQMALSLQEEDEEITKRIAEIQAQKDQVDLLNQAIPDRPEIPDLYAHLETLLKTSNLTLSSIQAVDQTPKVDKAQSIPGVEGEPAVSGGAEGQLLTPSPTLGMVSVNMEAKGNMEGYKQFLSALEKSLRIIDVQNVEINTDTNGILTYRIVLRTYYQK